MYKTLWNHIKKNTKKHTTASVFLPVLVLGWTVIGLLAGALICPFLQVAVLVKATVVLCTGGYAGLIFGFFGGKLLSRNGITLFLFIPCICLKYCSCQVFRAVCRICFADAAVPFNNPTYP